MKIGMSTHASPSTFHEVCRTQQVPIKKPGCSSFFSWAQLASGHFGVSAEVLGQSAVALGPFASAAGAGCCPKLRLQTGGGQVRLRSILSTGSTLPPWNPQGPMKTVSFHVENGQT